MSTSGALPLGVGVFIPNAVGAINGFLTREQIQKWYKTLKRPKWTPPDQVFPIVWPTLYTGMGVASYIVWRDGGGFGGSAGQPLALYAANLALNAAWTPLFFTLHRLDLSLIDSVLLNATTVACIFAFKPINKVASCIMVPYLLWGCFATALNYNIWQNNKESKDEPKEESKEESE